jgi:hypothetical protein
MAKKRELTIIGGVLKPVPAPRPEPIMPKISFQSWWLSTQSRLKLCPELREALYKHMKSRGFLDSGMFDDGLRDFGIKG